MDYKKIIFIQNNKTPLCFYISDTQIHLIPNKKKHPLLMYKRYTYSSACSTKTGYIYWRCSKVAQGCKASLRTNKDKSLNQFDVLHRGHNHDPLSLYAIWRLDQALKVGQFETCNRRN